MPDNSDICRHVFFWRFFSALTIRLIESLSIVSPFCAPLIVPGGGRVVFTRLVSFHERERGLPDCALCMSFTAVIFAVWCADQALCARLACPLFAHCAIIRIRLLPALLILPFSRSPLKRYWRLCRDYYPPANGAEYRV